MLKIKQTKYQIHIVDEVGNIHHIFYNKVKANIYLSKHNRGKK